MDLFYIEIGSIKTFLMTGLEALEYTNMLDELEIQYRLREGLRCH